MGWIMQQDAEVIGVELDEQNDLLWGLNDNMDQAQRGMMKVDTRIKRAIASSNQFCLCAIVLLELVAIFLICWFIRPN